MADIAAAADKAGQQLTDDGDKKKGMVLEGRSCTDLACLILFIFFWIGMFAVAGIAFANGDAKRLIYATDYQGNTCGVDSLASKKRVVYPRTNEDLLMNAKDGNLDFSNPTSAADFKFYGICVDKCPAQNEPTCNYWGMGGADDWSVGTPLEGKTGKQVKDTVTACFTNPKQAGCDKVNDNCWISPANQSSTFFRCLPVYKKVTDDDQVTCISPANWTGTGSPMAADGMTVTGCLIVEVKSGTTYTRPAQPNILFDKINSAASLWGRWFGDLQRASWVIFVCGVVVAVVISFLFLFFLRIMAGCMVWTTILLTIVLSVAITLFLYAKAGILDPNLANDLLSQAGLPSSSNVDTINQNLVPSENNKDKFKYAAWVFTAGTIGLICAVVAVRKQIKDAIKIIKTASKAIGSRPMVIFYPLFTVACLIGLLMWWVYVAAALFSAGTITTFDAGATIRENLEKLGHTNSTAADALASLTSTNVTMSVVEPIVITRYLAAYHFFGLLWTNQVLQGIGMMTIAGCIAAWYFEQGVPPPAVAEGDDEEEDKTSRFPVFEMWKRTMRYHLGSIAFGGLLIAFFQFVRAVVHYIEQQMKKQGQDSRMVKLVMCALKSILWCMQKCMEVITRNAFIYIAIKGQSFCSAALKVVATVALNPALMATVNAIGEVMMIFARAFVTCTCGFIAFLMLDNLSQFQEGGEDQLTGTWLPVLFTLIFAYFTSAAFFYVFDIAMDTILICFIVDKEENDGKAIHMDAGRFANKNALKMHEAEEAGEDVEEANRA